MVLKVNSKSNNRIALEGQQLPDIDHFSYLGANVSNQGGGGRNIENRIRKVRVVAFIKLKQIWKYFCK